MKQLFILFLILSMAINMVASDDLNDNQNRKVIDITQTTPPERSHNKLPYIAPLMLQNTTIQNSQYVIASDVVAGSNIESSRTAGDVTIANGVEYEVEYKGSVTLKPGFKVEKGATLRVTPSEY